MRFGTLFSGIGGDALGLEVAGHTPAWFAETSPYPSSVLSSRWPEIPNLGDVTVIDWTTVEPVDLIAGGFPCNDISDAHTNGHRDALDGRQSGLWSHFLEAVGVLYPRWVIVENVAAWSRWVPDVRSALAGIGYPSVPLELSSGSFGAPHKRPRVFVVAHANSDGEPLRSLHAAVAGLRPVPRGGGNWRSPAPGGFRVDDGVPNGMDRCHALGNSVMPQAMEWLGRQIARLESGVVV